MRELADELGRALQHSRLAGSKTAHVTRKWLGVQVLCAYCGLELAHWDQVRMLKSTLLYILTCISHAMVH